MTSLQPPPGAADEGWGDGALLHAIVERAQDIIVVIDSEGIIRYANGAVTTATGWQPQEVLARDGSPC